MQKNHSLFEVMFSAVSKQFEPNEEEINLLSEWLFAKYLSQHHMTVEVSRFLNSTKGVPIENQYLFARSAIPKGKIKFIPFNKAQKLTDREKIIQEYYNLNDVQAKNYSKDMPDFEFKRIEKLIQSRETQKLKREKS